MQIMDGDGFVDRSESKLVRFAISLTAFDAAAGQPARESIMVVVSAVQGRLLCDRSATELTAPLDEC